MEEAWCDLEQWRIQFWTERIPYGVIGLESVNEYSDTLDKGHWIAICRETTPQMRYCRIPAKYGAHLKSLAGIQGVVDVEDLNTDERREICQRLTKSSVCWSKSRPSKISDIQGALHATINTSRLIGLPSKKPNKKNN